MDRPRPLLKIAGIVGTALAAVSAAMQYGVLDGTLPADIATPVGAVIGFLLPLGAALGVWTFGEGHVTPVADPVSVTGDPLTVDQLGDPLGVDTAVQSVIDGLSGASTGTSDPGTGTGALTPIYDATADSYGRHAA